MARAEATVKVYHNVEELPEELPPGKYVVEGIRIELVESAERELVRKLVELARNLRGKNVEPL